MINAGCIGKYCLGVCAMSKDGHRPEPCLVRTENLVTEDSPGLLEAVEVGKESSEDGILSLVPTQGRAPEFNAVAAFHSGLLGRKSPYMWLCTLRGTLQVFVSGENKHNDRLGMARFVVWLINRALLLNRGDEDVCGVAL